MTITTAPTNIGDSLAPSDAPTSSAPTTTAPTRWLLTLLSKYTSVGTDGSALRADFISNFTSEVSALLSTNASTVPKQWVQVFDVKGWWSVVVDFRVVSYNGVSLDAELEQLSSTLAESNTTITGAYVESLNSFMPSFDSVVGEFWSNDVEFAYMLQGEVDIPEYMGSLSDDIFRAFGSDADEDVTSLTTARDNFRYDSNLGYNVYQLTFNIAINSQLGWQYVYSQIRYRTLMVDTSVNLSSKTHVSMWMRCVACTSSVSIEVKLLSPSDVWGTQVDVGPVGASWTNFKAPFPTSELSAVDRISFTIKDIAAGMLELALITGTNSAIVSTMMPTISEHVNNQLQLADCSYFYEHFRSNHIEWAYYSIDRLVPNLYNPSIFETDGTGTVVSEVLVPLIPEQRQIGFFSYTVTYNLNAVESYGYISTNYLGAPVFAPVATDVSSFGSHVCVWIKAVGQPLLQILLTSDSNSGSGWTIPISESTWQHYCLALTDLQEMKGFVNPVDLTQLKHVNVADTSGSVVVAERTLSIALFSFANSSTTYSVFPATMDPYIAVSTNSDGSCAHLVGPAPMLPSEIPPVNVPAVRYAIPSKYGYSGSDRSRLAVYISDIESKWLDVTHSLKTMGIPFFLTTDLSWALEFDTVFVYPFAPDDAIRANPLVAHVQAGKTVIFMQVVNTMYLSVCGAGSSGGFSKDMSYISFDPTASSLIADWTVEVKAAFRCACACELKSVCCRRSTTSRSGKIGMG